MNRRGFLKSCLALAAAPAIVKAESIMRIVVPQSAIIVPAQEIESAVLVMAQTQLEAGPTGYTFSRLVKRASGTWERESYHTDSPVQPVVKMFPDGRIDMGVPHTRVTSPTYDHIGSYATLSGKSESYVALGDPKGLYVSQASLLLSPPSPHAEGLYYPLTHDLEPRPMPLEFARRAMGQKL